MLRLFFIFFMFHLTRALTSDVAFTCYGYFSRDPADGCSMLTIGFSSSDSLAIRNLSYYRLRSSTKAFGKTSSTLLTKFAVGMLLSALSLFEHRPCIHRRVPC